MKNFLISTALLISTLSYSYALEYSIGATANVGKYSPSGTETINSATPESTSEDIYVPYASIFGEIHLNDNFRLGMNYVPYALESETTENARVSTTPAVSDGTNNVQVDVENLASVYISLYHDTGAFVKAGFMQGDLKTNESLYTGSTYGDAELEGYVVGGGFEKNLNDGIFIRSEINYSEFDDITLNSSGSDNSNKIEVKDLDGITGALSVGKTF
jgi:opacity protein-like surface antigen